MRIPASVTHDDLQAALEPFYELLGINSKTLFRDPGIYLVGDRIRFVVAANTGGTEPSERPAPARAGTTEFPPHPQGTTDPFNSLPVVIGEGHSREYAYDVCVEVIR
jgi:hypothetical protein